MPRKTTDTPLLTAVRRMGDDPFGPRDILRATGGTSLNSAQVALGKCPHVVPVGKMRDDRGYLVTHYRRKAAGRMGKCAPMPMAMRVVEMLAEGATEAEVRSAVAAWVEGADMRPRM